MTLNAVFDQKALCANQFWILGENFHSSDESVYAIETTFDRYAILLRLFTEVQDFNCRSDSVYSDLLNVLKEDLYCEE